MTYYLYAHAGSGNHGCEAIVRGTKEVLNEELTVFSMNPDQDITYELNKLCDIRKDIDVHPKKGSFPWFDSRLQTKLTGSIDKEIYYRKKSMFDSVKKGDVVFSIGGDNYCYKGTDILAAQNSIFKKKKAKTVLWGCSVEPELLKEKCIADDLANYDLIVARESISFNALKTINENVCLVPDPAFTLKRVDLPLPRGWVEGKMIGINASPLILQNAKNEEAALNAYRKLIEYIIEETPYHVALIPHVVWETNDDRKPLSMLYEEFKASGKVVLIEDHNCMELKGYIARCKMFVGARTHSTIASYSSCVPTLVLGYSVKSKGIAKDLFGTSENYVIPVQNLKYEDELLNNFKWLSDHEEEIRNHLESIMEEYKSRLEIAKNQLNELI